jgi:hypothetical protein
VVPAILEAWVQNLIFGPILLCIVENLTSKKQPIYQTRGIYFVLVLFCFGFCEIYLNLHVLLQFFIVHLMQEKCL